MTDDTSASATRWMWEIRTKGGSPWDIRNEILAAIGQLRAGEPTRGHLYPDEINPWMTSVDSCVLSDPVVAGAWSCVLVDLQLISIDNPARTAAILSGGFDQEILPRVSELSSVEGTRRTDSVQRDLRRAGIYLKTTPMMLAIDAVSDLIAEAQGQQANLMHSARRAALVVQDYSLFTGDNMARMPVPGIIFSLLTDLMLFSNTVGIDFDLAYGKAVRSFRNEIER